MHFLKLAEKLPKFFTIKDVQLITGTLPESARVLCMRYTKNGVFFRIRRDLYCFEKVFTHLDRGDFFELSALIQEHSYLSFSTALAYYGILPTLPHLIEAVSFKRSVERKVGKNTWKYHKLPKALFFAYQQMKTRKQAEFFIASPEKALLDTLYLYSLGRYYIDLKKINLERIDFEKLVEGAEKFPVRTKKLLARLYARPKRRSR